MRPVPTALVAALALALLASSVLAPAARAVAPAAPSSSPIVGNVTGPALVATLSNATFYLNASGGPAYSNGELTGTLNWSATVLGTVLTGYSVTPSSGTITNTTVGPTKMTVTTGGAAESLRVLVQVTSISSTANATTNLSVSFRCVVPYVVNAVLVAGSGAVVLPFTVGVALDGVPIGAVQVPELQPNATYDLVYRYPSGGLSSGYHTFSLSIADPHGLVAFANGLTVESTTFYVAPAPPSNTVWYITGVVAFFGVLFIYGTRVAARRRGSTRR